jgi:hypothetical protein
MSGPKTGHISLTPRALFDQQCQQLENWLMQQASTPDLSVLESEIKAARGLSNVLREASYNDQAELLDAANECREELSLFVNQRRAEWPEITKAIAQLKEQLEAAKRLTDPDSNFSDWSGQTRAIRAAGGAARKAVQKAESDLKRVGALRHQLDMLMKQVKTAVAPSAPEAKRDLSTSIGPTREKVDLKKIRRAALAAELDRRLERLRATSVEIDGHVKPWVAGNQRWTHYEKLLEQAKNELDRGALEEADKNIAASEAGLEELRKEAAENREAANRNEQIADAIMQALCDRNYNTPIFGELEEGNQLGGIQIRADVPHRDGKGNLRIDLHLDGRTVFEVENIDEGEESVCKDVINGVGAALAGSGLALDMTDWGRAHRAQNQQRSIIVPETTRMEKEREVNLS